MLPLPECRPFTKQDRFADADWFLDHKPKEWPSRLGLTRPEVVLAAAAVLDWLMPDWKSGRPTDTAPVRALEAVRANPIAPTDALCLHARALAKACTASRRRSLGYQHRIAKAARALALASAAESETVAIEAVAEALEHIEAHAKYAFAIVAIYGKERAIREEMLNRINSERDRVASDLGAGRGPESF